MFLFDSCFFCSYLFHFFRESGDQKVNPKVGCGKLNAQKCDDIKMLSVLIYFLF